MRKGSLAKVLPLGRVFQKLGKGGIQENPRQKDGLYLCKVAVCVCKEAQENEVPRHNGEPGKTGKQTTGQTDR